MSRNADALQMQIALQMQNADAECRMQMQNADADADQKNNMMISQTACAPEALGRIYRFAHSAVPGTMLEKSVG